MKAAKVMARMISEADLIRFQRGAEANTVDHPKGSSLQDEWPLMEAITNINGHSCTKGHMHASGNMHAHVRGASRQ